MEEYPLKIAGTLEIYREKVGHNIHEILNRRKLSAKGVPKYLNPGRKGDRMLASLAILNRGIFNRFATMDKRSIHMIQRNKASKVWKHGGSPHPRQFETQKLSSKVLASVF
jgi:hypothetical protein